MIRDVRAEPSGRASVRIIKRQLETGEEQWLECSRLEALALADELREAAAEILSGVPHDRLRGDPMNLDAIVFLDTETTGLDAVLDPIWEVAAVRRVDGHWLDHRWHLPIDVGRVSEWVRDNTGFADRYDLHHLTPHSEFCDSLDHFIDGAHVAGNVISFDTERLGNLYRSLDRKVPWHYHIIDVEPVAVGRLAADGVTVDLPWDSHRLSEELGVPVPDGRHDAMVDALWARDVFLAAIRDTP